MKMKPLSNVTPPSPTTIFSTARWPGREEVAYHYIKRGGTPVPPSHRSLTPAEEQYKAEMKAGLPPTRPHIPTEDEFLYIGYLREKGLTWREIGERLDRNASWLCHSYNRERENRAS